MKHSTADIGAFTCAVIVLCLSGCGRGDSPGIYGLRTELVGVGEYAAEAELELRGYGPFDVSISFSDAEHLRRRAAKDGESRKIEYAVRFFNEAHSQIHEMEGVEIYGANTTAIVVDRVIVPLHLPVDKPIRTVIRFRVEPSFPDEENTVVWLSFQRPLKSI